MTSPNKPQSLREKAEEIILSTIGENHSYCMKNDKDSCAALKSIESVLREAVFEERRRCADISNNVLLNHQFYGTSAEVAELIRNLILKETEGE